MYESYIAPRFSGLCYPIGRKYKNVLLIDQVNLLPLTLQGKASSPSKPFTHIVVPHHHSNSNHAGQIRLQVLVNTTQQQSPNTLAMASSGGNIEATIDKDDGRGRIGVEDMHVTGEGTMNVDDVDDDDDDDDSIIVDVGETSHDDATLGVAAAVVAAPEGICHQHEDMGLISDPSAAEAPCVGDKVSVSLKTVFSTTLALVVIWPHCSAATVSVKHAH